MVGLGSPVRKKTAEASLCQVQAGRRELENAGPDRFNQNYRPSLADITKNKRLPWPT